MRGNHLIREARRRAGLTQAQLAARAGTTQSAIARLERGGASPTLKHLTGLLKACGYDLQLRLVPYDDHDWTLAEGNLLLDPEGRLRKLSAAVRLAASGREAMTAARGR